MRDGREEEAVDARKSAVRGKGGGTLIKEVTKYSLLHPATHHGAQQGEAGVGA